LRLWDSPIEHKLWFPNYAITNKIGVITDKPQLITLESLNGLSPEFYDTVVH